MSTTFKKFRTAYNVGESIYRFTQGKPKHSQRAPPPSSMTSSETSSGSKAGTNSNFPAKTLEEIMPLALTISGRDLPIQVFLQLCNLECERFQPLNHLGVTEVSVHANGTLSYTNPPAFDIEAIITSLNQNPNDPLVAAVGSHNLVEQQQVQRLLSRIRTGKSALKAKIASATAIDDSEGEHYRLSIKQGVFPPPKESDKWHTWIPSWLKKFKALARKKTWAYVGLVLVALCEGFQFAPGYWSHTGVDVTNLRRELMRNFPLVLSGALFSIIISIAFFYLGKLLIHQGKQLVDSFDQEPPRKSAFRAAGLAFWGLFFGLFCFSLAELRHSISTGAQIMQGQTSAPDSNLNFVFLVITAIVPLICGMITLRLNQKADESTLEAQKAWDFATDREAAALASNANKADQHLAAIQLNKEKLARYQLQYDRLEYERKILEAKAQEYEQQLRQKVLQEWESNQVYSRTLLYNLQLSCTAYHMAMHDNNQKRNRNPEREASMARILELANQDLRSACSA